MFNLPLMWNSMAKVAMLLIAAIAGRKLEIRDDRIIFPERRKG